jgi:hypothetical protein
MPIKFIPMKFKLLLILLFLFSLSSCRKSYKCEFTSMPDWEYSNIKSSQADALKIQCENEGGVWVNL